MKTERTVARLRDATGQSDPKLYMAARDLGHEFPRRRLDVLATFRSETASLPPAADPFIAGFRAALLEVAAAFEAAVEPELEEDALVEEARRENWLPALEQLNKFELPSNPAVHRILVACWLAESPPFKFLTLRGKRVLARLKRTP